MRTTLSLDDDVAAMLRRALARTRRSLKEVVNDALRRGLQSAAPRRKSRYRTRSLNLGRQLVPSLDNIGDVLALGEGDDYK